MTNFFQSKRNILILTILVLIAVAVIVVLVQNSNKKQNAQLKPAEFKAKQTDVSMDQLPAKFPSDIPIEAGAKIIQNYNATSNDGRFQGTRAFESSKTMDENVKIYNDFAKKKSWKLGTAIDQPKFKVVSATKGNLNLVVTISESSGKVTVSITVTEQVAAPQ